MGIPKFFRLISERWPLISQEITSPEQIQYDNLYLDMNSILHNCSHGNDGISHMTDEQIFGAIFAYIDHLFNLIRPQKVFYMAIDGVAPRAKMNQQRARRFRSAVEAEEMMKKAIASGEPIPQEPAFDTNSITPGTEFMAKVTENLKFYINQKVSTDRRWKDIQVILSGHEVPGEGEHKIMDYIRVQKAQPDYNPFTRHCVYGLDADLIILGLVSHEPYFSLLREEVKFGRNNKSNSSDLSNQNFLLLHISLVRDYLREEFKDLADEITFEYDFERVIDDFVLILYVIGNDFLPNLPDLHLNHGAFPLLLHTFKEAMSRSDGYINEHGQINFKRLGIWLEILSIFEFENFEEGAVDVEWFNKQLDNVSRRGEKKRLRQGKELLLKQQKKMVGLISNWILRVYNDESFDIKEFYHDSSKIPQLDLPSEFFESEMNLEFIRKFAFEIGLIVVHKMPENTYTAKVDIDGIDINATKDDIKNLLIEIKQTVRRYDSGDIVEDEKVLHSESDLYDQKFTSWKDSYYKDKLHFSIKDEDSLLDITENYLEGLQWVLNYYYTGLCSWPWYYRYHYAPRISDLSRGLNVKINFEMGKPFTPFEQLMSVLPARSKTLIPVVYRHLMTEEDSPILDFYPDDCEVDKNGKSASWEAVVLLSFVDEKRLQQAMAPLNARLSLEEKKRNSFGHDLIFNFNPQVKTLIKSPIPQSFPDFESHATESKFVLPSMDGLNFVIGLSESLRSKDMSVLDGFPTLSTIPHSSNLELANLVVFQQPARSESMILTLENEFENITPQQFANLYCDKIVYANWPYLREYKVVHVSDSLMKYEMSKTTPKVISSPLESFEIAEYNKNIEDINYFMHNKRGLHFSSKDISEEIIINSEPHNNKKTKNKEPIDALVYLKQVTGVTPSKSGKLVKVFSQETVCFPMQLIVPAITNPDPRFFEKEPVPIDVEYPVNSHIVFLGAKGYGTSAIVCGHANDKLMIKYNLCDEPEPTYGIEAYKNETKLFVYHSGFDTAKYLGVQRFILSKITSSYMIIDTQGKKVNVGLSLKYEGKGIKTLGYTRKVGRDWEYSDFAVNYIREYIKEFPELFNALVQNKDSGIPKATSIFKNKSDSQISEYIRNVKDYLLNKSEKLVQVSLTSDSLSRPSIAKIEDAIVKYSEVPHKMTTYNVKNIPRAAVLNPSIPILKLKHQVFKLGDRVVYIMDSGLIPLFSKGTVIGYRSSETSVSVHVLFDNAILTCNTFDGKLKTKRGLSVDSSSLLNITNKEFVYGAPSKKKVPSKKSDFVSAQKKNSEQLKQKEEQLKLKKEKEIKKNTTKQLLNIIGGEKKEEKFKKNAEAANPSKGAKETHSESVKDNINNGSATKETATDSIPSNPQAAKKLMDLVVNAANQSEAMPPYPSQVPGYVPQGMMNPMMIPPIPGFSNVPMMIPMYGMQGLAPPPLPGMIPHNGPNGMPPIVSQAMPQMHPPQQNSVQHQSIEVPSQNNDVKSDDRKNPNNKGNNSFRGRGGKNDRGRARGSFRGRGNGRGNAVGKNGTQSSQPKKESS